MEIKTHSWASEKLLLTTVRDFYLARRSCIRDGGEVFQPEVRLLKYDGKRLKEVELDLSRVHQFVTSLPSRVALSTQSLGQTGTEMTLTSEPSIPPFRLNPWCQEGSTDKLMQFLILLFWYLRVVAALGDHSRTGSGRPTSFGGPVGSTETTESISL